MSATLPAGFLPKDLYAPDDALVHLDDLDADAGSASRLLADHAGGRVVQVALSDGAELAEHAAPMALLVVGLGGEAHFTIGGVSVPVRAGVALRIAPRERHAVRAVGPTRFLLVLHRV